MTIIDAVVIYLSAGAPFGVLVFLGRPADGYYRSVAYAAIAVLLWPFIAVARIAEAFSKSYRQSTFAEKPLSDSAGERGGIHNGPNLTNGQKEVLDRYLTLKSLADKVPEEPAEFFDIAGHPNPMLATVCNARRRNMIVLKHLADATSSYERMRGGVKRQAAPGFGIEDNGRTSELDEAIPLSLLEMKV